MLNNICDPYLGYGSQIIQQAFRESINFVQSEKFLRKTTRLWGQP